MGGGLTGLLRGGLRAVLVNIGPCAALIVPPGLAVIAPVITVRPRLYGLLNMKGWRPGMALCIIGTEGLLASAG